MEEKNELSFSERNYGTQILGIIRSDCAHNEIKAQLQEYHENDIASIFEELTSEEREKLLQILGSEIMSEIVSFLDNAGNYLSEIDADDAAEIIEQMDADDAVEALEDLDEQTRNEIFDLIENPEVREDIEMIVSYDDDEFGSRMSTNFIAVKRTQTIKETMKALVREAAENDNVYTIFVVNDDGSFYGVIDLKDLIVARSNVELETLICNTFPFVYDKDIISENIERLRGYSESMIPVISSDNKALLGVITSTDITELIDEERGDDYAKLAAMTAEQEPDEPLFTSMKKRVPWLIALLFMGLIVSTVVSVFESVVAALPMIVSFQSLILGMAGNVGTQSLAVTVRALGDKANNNFKMQIFTILKEIRVALLNGCVLGAISFLIISGYLFVFASYGATFVFAAAGCVGLAMCFAMAISGLTGAAIPICLYRFGVDPAVASGPLITTINDLVAVISYYGLAWALLLKL
ncbi:MAG: magnesium transporter [Ruminococcaceae bacterium]|nr:magnesium transporter [Oscillospiraceae bacterium]